MDPLSRREFVGVSALISQAAGIGQATPSTLTAGEVVNRIKQHIGVPWRAVTVDQLIAGDESTRVQGIASVMMATQEVVERAAAEGKNMIVTHETPFYLHQDKIEDIRENPVLQYKLNFIRQHDVAIFHFHDHWHMRHPDGIAEGMVRELGWEKYLDDPTDPKRLTFPGTPLAKFAKGLQDRLHARTMMVAGNPDLPVRRVQWNPQHPVKG